MRSAAGAVLIRALIVFRVITTGKETVVTRVKAVPVSRRTNRVHVRRIARIATRSPDWVRSVTTACRRDSIASTDGLWDHAREIRAPNIRHVLLKEIVISVRGDFITIRANL